MLTCPKESLGRLLTSGFLEAEIPFKDIASSNPSGEIKLLLR